MRSYVLAHSGVEPSVPSSEAGVKLLAKLEIQLRAELDYSFFWQSLGMKFLVKLLRLAFGGVNGSFA